jgi:hypothetical protein
MADVPPESDRHKKQCTTCGEEIAYTARKCIHCDSYQDWRRYLTFSSTVLALLVALLSVATVAGPVFRDLLTIKDSDLVASFQGVNADDQAVFVVSNLGTRPGTVGEVLIMVAPSESGEFHLYRGFPLASGTRDESIFVDAGKSAAVRYGPGPSKYDSSWGDFSWERDDIAKFQCAIGILLINFSGPQFQACFKYSCSEIARVFFPGHQPAKSGPIVEGQPSVFDNMCRQNRLVTWGR